MTSINTNDLYSLLKKNVGQMPSSFVGVQHFASTKLQEMAIERVYDTQQSENNQYLTDLEKRKLQLAELGATNKHVQDTTAVLGGADKGLEETEAKLKRMKEIAEKLRDEQLEAEEQMELKAEFEKRKEEIDKIGEETNYNKHKLLDGSLELVTQTNKHGGKDQSIKIDDMRKESLGIADLTLSSMKDVITSVARLDEALSIVSKQRFAIDKETDELAEISGRMKYKLDKGNEEENESFFTTLKDPDEASKASANIKGHMLTKKEEMYKRLVSMFVLNPSDVFKLLSE